MLCHQDELCQPLVEMLRALLPDAISLAEEWWNGCWKNPPIQKRTTGQADVSKARYKFSFQRCSARYIWYGLWRGINAVWYLTSIKKSWPSCRQVPAKSSFPLWHLAQMWRPTVRGRGDLRIYFSWSTCSFCQIAWKILFRCMMILSYSPFKKALRHCLGWSCSMTPVFEFRSALLGWENCHFPWRSQTEIRTLQPPHIASVKKMAAKKVFSVRSHFTLAACMF